MRRAALLACLSAACALSPAQQSSQPVPPPIIVQPGPPGAPSKTLPPNATVPLPKDTPADVAFMQGMIMHHNQAVVMTAMIPSHTDNPDVLAIGKKIHLSQTDEMKFMKRWLTARGQSTMMPMTPGKPMALMPGMLTPEQMDALSKSSGKEFDRLFLTGMIQHHGGALIMVKDLFNEPGAGEDAELFNFATDVDSTQRAEIKIMQRILKEIQ